MIEWFLELVPVFNKRENMKKLNSVIYNKLLVQSEEAKEQNLIKLADGVSGAIENGTETEFSEYSYSQLNEDVYNSLWKLATNVLYYHGTDAIDVKKIDEVISSMASTLIDQLEEAMDTENVIVGALEPKVPGEF